MSTANAMAVHLERTPEPLKPEQPKKFSFALIPPFSTFTEDGKSQPIPYIVESLYPCGGLSCVGSKAKNGKSSFSARYQGVQISKGLPILGRETKQGEVWLVSLEDPKQHIDNCLAALGYQPDKDAMIHTSTVAAPKIEDTCEAICNVLAHYSDIVFVSLDTLAKILRVPDLNEYMRTLEAAEQLHKVAREFCNGA